MTMWCEWVAEEGLIDWQLKIFISPAIIIKAYSFAYNMLAKNYAFPQKHNELKVENLDYAN